jgi:hypothetical protein
MVGLVAMHWTHHIATTIRRGKHERCKRSNRACQQGSRQQQRTQPRHNQPTSYHSGILAVSSGDLPVFCIGSINFLAKLP